MTRDDQLSDESLRLECARLAAVFSEGDLTENAERLYRFIRDEEGGDTPVRRQAEAA